MRYICIYVNTPIHEIIMASGIQRATARLIHKANEELISSATCCQIPIRCLIHGYVIATVILYIRKEEVIFCDARCLNVFGNLTSFGGWMFWEQNDTTAFGNALPAPSFWVTAAVGRQFEFPNCAPASPSSSSEEVKIPDETLGKSKQIAWSSLRNISIVVSLIEC
jgi:hypothetical protein